MTLLRLGSECVRASEFGRAGSSQTNLLGNDAHEVAVILPVVLHFTVRLRVQSVITAPAHQRPRVNSRPTLPHKDGPTQDTLTTKDLNPQPLRLGVSSVAR
jgi:hypothetical protein